jgi:LmbE family N-acetylglucosaminyl deacetylase
MIGHVLHIGVHPDDEDAGLMAYVSRKYGARMVYWSATRGEAGQNRIGSYSGDALGIYRTWESVTARAIDGGESWYGPFYDFGYCTSGTEAIAKWGWEALVREIVRAIRLAQPQVIVARYTGDAFDGHGQHQAIGAATAVAYDAAADPGRFPELGLPAWPTPKLYHSTDGDWQAGEQHTLGQRRPELEHDGYLRIDTGEHDPIAGMSYQQQASLALNCHQTQALGFVPEHGSYSYYYRLKRTLVATPAREQSLYDGLEPTLIGLASYPGGAPSDCRGTLEAILSSIDAAMCRLRPDDPTAAAGPLLEGPRTTSPAGFMTAASTSSGASTTATRRFSVAMSRVESSSKVDWSSPALGVGRSSTSGTHCFDKCLPASPGRSGFSQIFWRCRRRSLSSGRSVFGRCRSFRSSLTSSSSPWRRLRQKPIRVPGPISVARASWAGISSSCSKVRSRSSGASRVDAWCRKRARDR